MRGAVCAVQPGKALMGEAVNLVRVRDRVRDRVRVRVRVLG